MTEGPAARGNGQTGDDPLRVGFLHVGRARSGVRRYGRIIASALGARSDVTPTEIDAGDRDASIAELRAAAGGLRETDVVQLQWKLADWDPRLGGIPRTEAVRRAAGRPTVLTLHDVLPRETFGETWLSPGAWGWRWLGRTAARIVVHAEVERDRLDGFVPADRVTVIPHFVDDRPPLPARDDARRTLGVEGRRVVTLLGAMTKRRGHRLVLEALVALPDDVVALFVGSPIEGRDHIEAGLRRTAVELGVADRVRFLGYVSDDDLESVLAATDLGLAPFREMSASGALATWISARRPIVASDLPAIAELDAIVPGALERFTPYTAPALANRIISAFERATAGPDPLVGQLAERLAVARIVERYVAVYRGILGG